MKALTAALILSLAAGGPVLAAAKPDPKAAAAMASYVNLSPVALPVVADGVVVNYVFVNMRIDLTPGAPSDQIRAKEPYFRDALVRAAHRTPFTLATDYTKIDEARLCASLLAEVRTIVGPGLVTDVKVMTQTPKSNRVPTPRQAN